MSIIAERRSLIGSKAKNVFLDLLKEESELFCKQFFFMKELENV
jgi:hypothetical protein